MLVCVASTNPVKLEATREALIEIGKGWEVKGVEGESGVSAQPGAMKHFRELRLGPTRLCKMKNVKLDWVLRVEYVGKKES